MPTANAAIVPAQKSSGPMVMLTAMPTSLIKDQVVVDGSKDAAVGAKVQSYMDRIRAYIPVEVIGSSFFATL